MIDAQEGSAFNIRIGPVQGEDLEALAVLYAELLERSCDRQKMEHTWQELSSRPDYILLGARQPAGELVGTVMGIVCLDLAGGCEPFMVMENLIVAREWQGQGVGRQLMQTLEAEAKARGCHFLQFCSSQFRKGAHRFYAALGYAPDVAKGFRKYISTE